MFPATKAEWITHKRSNQRSDELWWPILAQVASFAICLVNRNVLDFSLMFHDVNSPTRPTLISQGVGVSLTLTQRALFFSHNSRHYCFFKFMSSTSMLEVYNLRYMGNRCIGI
jgi:hypothetical protein